MKLLLTLFTALVLTTSFEARAQSSEEEAGDVSEVDKDAVGPLRERIRPVSGYLFRKGGRFEFSPSATVSLKDAFYTKYLFGGALTFHPTDNFGISLRGVYGISTISGTAQICTTGTGARIGCRYPTELELNGRAPGQIRLVGGLDVQWAPIYGKIALVAERFLHFDLYGIGGGGVVQYMGPPDSGTGSIERIAPALNIGAGLRFFVNRWLMVRTELRDLIYAEAVQPLPATSLRNQLLFELGFSFFFPTNFGEE
jgi:outer membrane beta-barrel protein